MKFDNIHRIARHSHGDELVLVIGQDLFGVARVLLVLRDPRCESLS
ncbi:MAG: hypothetical protein ABSF77_06735 [Spirochaetia bacterium]|jgi:hypothetical protein